MNIKKENTDTLNAIVTVEITREDYEPKVQEVLKDYRKRAHINGFRPGHVPLGLITKLYYTPVKVEEINKLVSNSLVEYIRNENIHILGDPLPHVDENKKIDFEKQESFEFSFDLGLKPDFELTINKKTKIPYYKILADETMVNNRIEEICQHYGRFSDVEEVTLEAMMKGNLAEAEENGQPLEGGHSVQATIISVDRIADKDIQNLFLGKKPGDSVFFPLAKAFPSEADRAALLQTDKNNLPSLRPDVIFTIQDIKRYEKSPLDQKLFDQVFGEGQVTTEEEFRKKVKEDLEKSLEQDAEYRFTMDAKNILIEKTKITLPEEFLKRWMLESNEGKITPEEVEKEFGHFIDGVKWQLIMSKISNENNLTVTEEEIKEKAKYFARNQYLRYGLADVPEEYVENMANEILKKESEVENLARQIVEEKVYGWIKMNASLEEKEIDVEGLKKLFEK